MEWEEIKKNIIQIANFSKKLQGIIRSDDLLFDFIEDLPTEIKQTLYENFQKANGPILSIRQKVGTQLINGEIKRAEIINEFAESKKDYPHRFSQYKNLYHLLYPFVIKQGKDQVNNTLIALSVKLQEELSIKEFTYCKVNGFYGGRNTGDDQSWFAIYNNTHPNQKKAKQLFFLIYDGEIEYAVFDRDNNKMIESYKVKPEELEYGKLVELYNKYSTLILQDNFRLSVLQKYDFEKIKQDLLSENITGWLIKPGQQGSMWKQALREENIRIGWGDVVREVIDEDNFTEEYVLQSLDDNYKTETTQHNNKKSIISFMREVEEDDIVFAVSGKSDVIGVGVITSPLILDEEDEEYTATHDVDWLIDIHKKPLNPSFTLPIKTVTILSGHDSKELFTSIINFTPPIPRDPTDLIKNKLMSQTNLNTILYGPPGTGKTYNTIEKAIRIANPDFKFKHDDDTEIDRTTIKEEYNRLCSEGMIAFTTFHQSLSYEDFIEGIKPLKPEKDKSIQYDVKDGIFKLLSNKAFNNLLPKSSESVKDFVSPSFDQLYTDFLESIKPFEGKEEFPFQTIYKHDVKLVEIRGTSIIVMFRWQDTKKTAPAVQPFSITKEKIKQVFEGGVNPKGIKSLKDSFAPYFQHNLSVYYAVYKKFYEYVENNIESKSVEEIELSDNLSYDEIMEGWLLLDKETRKTNIADSTKFVLIIDEINRGNISQIFGELITLIEDDKRIGTEEFVEVILPYSKQKFAVPPNLYIIGTMNTADRSVEALDTALRRRFSFEFMPPDENKVAIDFEGIALRNIFSKINERIAFLLDNDHQIGHSYFMHLKDLNMLKLVFKNKIIPLLKEYFYNDYRKIHLVLGKDFVTTRNHKPTFAVNDNEEMARDIYTITPIDDKFDIKNALALTLGN